MNDQQLATQLAESGGQLLLELRRTSALEGKALGDAGDAAVHEFLIAQLSEHRPDDAVLSEEGADDPRRLSSPRVWIVDPLDGTREYAEGREDFAVHVALWQDGALVAGAVALPGIGAVLTEESRAPTSRADGPLRMAVSRTRAPQIVNEIAGRLDAELVPMGSAGFKVGAVVRGVVDAYVHDGGQYEWDSAAPVSVANAAGLHTSRLDGSPLRYNQANVWLPDLVVARSEIADRVMDAIIESNQPAD